MRPILYPLECAKGKSLTEIERTGILDLLEPLGEKKAREIVACISRMVNFPRNLYGAVLEAVEKNRDEARQSFHSREMWAAGDNCLSPQEHTQWMLCIQEVQNFHKLGLFEYNPNGCPPMDIDEWVSSGRPKTWSPLLDRILEGSIKAYKDTLSNNNRALANYFAAVYSWLMSEHDKAINQKATEIKEKYAEHTAGTD